MISSQIAIGTDDVYKTAEAVKLVGGKITREPGPLPGINTKITACLDPDGWKTVRILKKLCCHAFVQHVFSTFFRYIIQLAFCCITACPTSDRIAKNSAEQKM